MVSDEDETERGPNMLTLSDFAEFDGMTADFVRSYLYRRGYQVNGGLYTIGGITFGTSASCLMLPDIFSCIARAEGRSLQEVLTAINPRMVPMPPAEVRARHTGYWLAYRAGILHVGRFTGSEDHPWFEVHRSAPSGQPNTPWYDPGCVFEIHPQHYLFWPCDDMGKKARMPR